MAKKRIYVPLSDDIIEGLKKIAKGQKRSPVSVAADYIEDAVEMTLQRFNKKHI